MTGTKVEIPSMSKCPSYAHWKNLIKIWSNVSNIPKAKQADCLLLTLDTDGQNLALQVPDTERCKEDGSGLTQVLLRLDTLYEQNSTQKLFTAFEEFENLKRGHDMSLAKYISEFEIKVSELKGLNVSLPEELLAFKLLKNANLGEECTRIVRIACNTNSSVGTGNNNLTFEMMKGTIMNAFDCRLDIKSTGFRSGSTDSTGTVSVEPFKVKVEEEESYYTRNDSWNYQGRARGSGRNYNNTNRANMSNQGRNFEPYPIHPTRESRGRGNARMMDSRVNRIDRQTGKPSECRLCGSIYHFAFRCSRNKENSTLETDSRNTENSTLETHSVDVTLLAQGSL